MPWRPILSIPCRSQTFRSAILCTLCFNLIVTTLESSSKVAPVAARLHRKKTKRHCFLSLLHPR